MSVRCRSFDIFCIFAKKTYQKYILLRMKETIYVFFRRALLLVAGIFFANNFYAQTQIETFVPGSTLEGVSYFLPRTALRVVVTAEKEVLTPGKFYMYAFKFLRLQDVPTQQTVTWRLKDIKIHPYGVPDKSKAYSLKLKKQTSAPLVSLTPDGLLLGINTQVDTESMPALPKEKPAWISVTEEELSGCMTRDMIQAGSVAKTADLMAREIYTIRESRDLLLRGEADNTPKDGQQLKLMLDGLERQQQILSSAFTGTTEVKEVVFAFDIIPAEETDKLLLCRFSKRLGLVDYDDMAGAPVYISIKAAETLPAVVFDEKTAAKRGKMQKGVYYNLPVRTNLKIFDAEKTYVKMETPMAQFGRVELLSNELFDKMATTRVSFFQTTGGIREIENDASK